MDVAVALYYKYVGVSIFIYFNNVAEWYAAGTYIVKF